MKQEDKELLLKDLCARLPYGVKVNVIYSNENASSFRQRVCVKGDNELNTDIIGLYQRDEIDIRPYLFPLSSMTEAQRIELYKVLGLGYESHYHLSKEWEDFNNSIDNNGLFLPASWVSDLNKMYNWLNKNNFDYQGLIPMELAIDATGLNIY